MATIGSGSSKMVLLMDNSSNRSGSSIRSSGDIHDNDRNRLATSFSDGQTTGCASGIVVDVGTENGAKTMPPVGVPVFPCEEGSSNGKDMDKRTASDSSEILVEKGAKIMPPVGVPVSGGDKRSCNKRYLGTSDGDAETSGTKGSKSIPTVGVPVSAKAASQNGNSPEDTHEQGGAPGAFAMGGPGEGDEPMVAAVLRATPLLSGNHEDDDDDDEQQQVGLISHVADLVPSTHQNTIISRRQKQRRKLLLVLSLETNVVLLAIIVILLVFLAVYKGGHQRLNNTPSTAHIPATFSWDATTQTQTKVTSLLDRLNLPEYTQRAMENSRSPQSKAYVWLDTNVHNSSNYRNNLQMLPNWKLQQRFAMATLYYSARGEHWVKKDGWLDWSVDECNWKQLPLPYASQDTANPTCNSQGQLHTLSFGMANNLDGTIPPEIAFLEGGLQKLVIRQNSEVQGSIPTEIGLLTRLAHLQISSTGISGRFPSEIGQLKLLDFIVLSDSPISGSIPSELGVISNLDSFTLLNTNHTGSLPSEFYNLQNLKSLAIMDCSGLEMESLLHSVIASMYQLESISLSMRSSDASMPFPSILGKLTGLSSFGLTHWKLNGSIPSEIGQLTKLSILALDGNSISGTMPTTLANLTNLQVLTVGSNRLQGKLPPSLFLHLKRLRFMGLNENQFSGPLPTEAGLLSKLMVLELQNTNLTGTLPTELLALEKLTSLVVSNTSLSGSIPVNLCDKLFKKDIKCFGGQCYPVTNPQTSCEGNTLCGCECGLCPLG